MHSNNSTNIQPPLFIMQINVCSLRLFPSLCSCLFVSFSAFLINITHIQNNSCRRLAKHYFNGRGYYWFELWMHLMHFSIDQLMIPRPLESRTFQNEYVALFMCFRCCILGREEKDMYFLPFTMICIIAHKNRYNGSF